MSNGMDRRGFFKLVGASSAAAATAAGCGRTTPEAILPFVVPPEHVVPGVASWYATVCRECPAGCGVLARSREGRVVKLEGNPDHPVNRGALCVRGQAAVLGTYDPDRIPQPARREREGWKPIAVAEAEALLVEKLRAAGPGRIAMITQLETGSLGRLMDEWLKAVAGRPRVAFEPFAGEALRAAGRAAFGIDAIPHHAFEEARAVVSLGADYLETWLSPVGYAQGFQRMHGYRGDPPGQVIHVEPRYSMTAASADEWVPNAPGTEGLVALALLQLVMRKGVASGLGAKDAETLSAVAGAVELEAVAKQSGVPVARLEHMADVLVRGVPSLVVGGGVAASGTGSTETATLIHLLNYALGNIGKTVRFGQNLALGQTSRYGDLLGLVRAMAAGEIAVLIVKDANPLYTLPPKAGFGEALAKVPFVVSLSSHRDETTAQAHLVVPDLTPLESWGDYVPREGVWGLMQPAMGPVPRLEPRRQDLLDLQALSGLRELLKHKPQEAFPGVQTKAAGDLLLATGRSLVPGSEKGAFQATAFVDYLKGAWQGIAKNLAPSVPFDTFWEESLRRGGVWVEVPAAKVTLQPGLRVPAVAATLEGPADGLALLVVPSSRFYDGRGANKLWLHEVPDPMTQVVYDGWVEIEAGVARRLGVASGDVVRVASAHGALELPAYLSETLHPEAVAIATGLGHTAYGRWATGLGQNPVRLLSAEPEGASGGIRWLGVRVSLTKTGRRAKLATPAGVTEVDHAREIVETIGFKQVRAAEQHAKKDTHGEIRSMYPDLKYPDHRWGMAIDLDACTGCQACVVACQAENNVPLVGRAETDYGRNLHWIRVERWWDRGHPEGAAATRHAQAGPLSPAAAHAAAPGGERRPQARFLPMLCQHCEVAPCEPVCPVFAAYHTSEGLNGQVYNRCVGTRYCGNNCPYMVRRFNWFRYDQFWPAPMPLVLNPDVTVRDRGVMEKCTMCVQRIVEGKDRARDAGRRPKDGEIVTACQQTCPTQAIVFGDLKDLASRASKLSHAARGYHVLGELGTRPAITYLKKVLREA